MADAIRVVIADDHPHELSGFADLLAFAGEIQVVGQAHTSQKAVALVLDLKPDVVLLDMIWYGSKEDGLTAIRQIREGAPKTGIMVMTNYDEMIEKAKKTGADLAIHKDYLNSKEALVNQIIATRESRLLSSPNESFIEKLSPREKEVLTLMCRGFSDKQIAQELYIAANTVKKNNTSIYNKLGVNSRAEAIALALRYAL